MVKNQDLIDERNEKEPNKLKLPNVSNAGVQADPNASMESLDPLPPASNTYEMQQLMLMQ